MNRKALHAILLAALLMSIAVGAQEAGKAKREDTQAMAPTMDGRPNPKAPEELSQLAFLIGTWRCDVEEKSRDGSWAKSQATWVWRYILDGYVIADEYRQIDSNGELVRLGATYRSFDTVGGAWIMPFLPFLVPKRPGKDRIATALRFHRMTTLPPCNRASGSGATGRAAQGPAGGNLPGELSLRLF